ncbi:hypothetical protein [Baekduia soli]|nr:hypothetical protein [Baekduia soli]
MINSSALIGAITMHTPGDKVAVRLTRGTATRSVTLTLGSEPTQATAGG